MELENSCSCQCAAGVRIKIGGGEHFLFLVLPGLWIPQEWGPNILIEGTHDCSECLEWESHPRISFVLLFRQMAFGRTFLLLVGWTLLLLCV